MRIAKALAERREERQRYIARRWSNCARSWPAPASRPR
jgi:hypothetical protein